MTIIQRHSQHLAGMARAANLTRRIILLLLGAALLSWTAKAQGSRHDDVVLGPEGHPVPGATITVCQATATGTPCSPLALIYTDVTLTVPAPNPFTSDGLGNYHFYAPAGRYLVQVTAPQISGTQTYPDVILPPDVSSTSAGNNLSAFGLTLGGNLTVAGNASINGTLTTSSFNPGTFSPSSLAVGGNESVAGPRPRIDVTAYGAKGTNVVDDTAAIQAAINAACQAWPSGGGGIYFPPGSYLVSQPQTPSTAPVFNIPTTCSGLYFYGGNVSNRFQVQSLGSAPMSAISVNAGAHPNGAPVFLLESGQGSATQGGVNSTFEDLSINAYNEAVTVYGATTIRFKNVCLGVNGTTGLADNTPLKLTNTFQIYFSGGCLAANGSGTTPIVEMTGETQQLSEGTLVGLVYISDVVAAGGGMQYIQRVASTGTIGNFVFRNIVLEDAATDTLTITNTSGLSGVLALPKISGFTFDNISGSDQGNAALALLNVNSSGTSVSGVWVNHSYAGQAMYGYAVRVTAGSVNNVLVTGCGDYVAACTNGVVDANNNPIGGATVETNNGFDYIVNTGDASDRLRTDIFPYNDINGPPLRATVSGNKFASLGIDPVGGLMFADGQSYGFNAEVAQTTGEALDIGFAQTLPPTGVTATPATGGTLAAGTYYYFVSSSVAANCNPGNTSALSQPSGAAVISGSNNAATITWSLPPAGTSTVAGFCVARSTANTLPGGYSFPNQFVSGATTTSFTDTGFTGGSYNQGPVNQIQSVHRFTPTSLGIDTLSPQFNLDVKGTAAVNSLNLVQKAERFAGSDAAVQINNCLIAASATSGVCDARGLAGTLTATHHISFPANTTLLWGLAQLTINDTTTNDAIEFTGDGAALVGYQESGLGTVPRPDASGYLACGIAGCTVAKNPNAATRNIDWIHIDKMYLLADGANSTVLNLTSVGHADIENNRIELGTGGSSYGIYGNTSTGDLDSTNSLIKHNEIDPESSNDACVSLSGIFNSIVFEQNSCYLPASNTGTIGFALAKDTNGNYPDNDEFYGNDCEGGGASPSFNQICFNIVGAQSIVIGPNNRCENVYNCFQFPSDGSAVGLHLLDPYISISSNSVVKPNEPAAAMTAVDNNGHNWLPSMHFGQNDLAGPNLLGNASFEGWQNSTTLYYWGGASGTNINQAGSGIYAQETSAGANPAADSYTQGAYNVRVGDGATAGLGVNSGCIQVDATTEYTLMFRVASASTSNNFRPGFRFYSDANCTEADRITSASSNARILTPANYAGQSSLVGTGANWQSTNASLTYNNGITCNCDVTGSDWQVATANLWTPTRNFAVTFRVPNAYGSSSTITHSMRVLLLENTAAAGNYVYFDDVVLSQGPASPDVTRAAPVHDSGGSNIYGSLAVSQHLNQGAAGTFAGTVALSGGTATVTFPTAFNSTPVCVANDQSAIATVRVQPSATQLVLTQSSGTDTINWICIGNPN
ncbi:MAG TPA: glycosyl hydrolase family 28-related protein [Verrucomicrobiae bacterium]|nr:glycosyl hydrolase family 28-related protein [Verrucomicrobiae bacterium]